MGKDAPPRLCLCLLLRWPGQWPQHSDALSVFSHTHHGWAGQAAGWLAARHVQIPCLPPVPLTAAWWPDLAVAAFKPTCAARTADPGVRRLMGSRGAGGLRLLQVTAGPCALAASRERSRGGT